VMRERETDTWATGVSDGERGGPLTGGPTRCTGPQCQCRSSTDKWAQGI
jgi:hypothetical protein